MNLSLGIPLSIWYDWHDDGADPKDPEAHFGTVTWAYQPKPAYHEIQRLVAALKGKRFTRRLPSDPADYLLVFSNGPEQALAAWTTGPAHTISLPSGQSLALTSTPVYQTYQP